MHYEKKIKLYPSELHYEYEEEKRLYNEDPFFYSWAPEELQELIANGWTLKPTSRAIRNEKVPMINCVECNDAECLTAAFIDDGCLNLDEYSDCSLNRAISRRAEKIKENILGKTEQEYFEAATRQTKAEREKEILDLLHDNKIVSAKYLKHKLDASKPSSKYEHPFKGFEKVDKSTEPLSWTVNGLIPNKSLCSIYGSSESLKSFLAIDIGACVATGTPFKGRATRQGPVLYFAPEGSTGVPIRRDAWMKENGWSDCFVPFYSRGGSFCFSSQNDRDYLADTLAFQSKYWQPRLIIFDTLGQSLGDADENSASDINKIARFLNDLKIAHDCSFIWIDHSGHETKRTRGSSAKTGALDAEFFVARKGDQITVTNTKMKDTPRCKPITLEAVQKHNSLILVEAKPDPSHADVLLEIMYVSVNASEHDIREKFYSLCSAETSAAKQKAFKRAVEKLIQDNLISKDEANGLAKLVLKTKAGHTPPLL